MSFIKKVLPLFGQPYLSFAKKINFFKTRNDVRVLIFHSIPKSQENIFETQINFLQKKYGFITPNEFENFLKGESVFSGTKLLLTFDDGFLSNKTIAEKILNPRAIKAIFFVLSRLILADLEDAKKIINQGVNAGTTNFETLPEEYLPMRLEDVQALIKQGHTIGSHTASHLRLSSINSSETLEQEIINSGDQLEKLLGISIRHFAYPFGSIESVNAKAIQMAEKRYEYIHSGIRGSNCPNSNKLIWRDGISSQYSLRDLKFIIEGGYDFVYLRARKKLRAMLCPL